jgi:hypothetical protein
MPRLNLISQSSMNGIGSIAVSPLIDLNNATVTTNANIYSRDSSTSWSSMDYNSNGTGVVITQGDGDSDARIYQYSLSVPYDLTPQGQSISYVGEQALGSSAFDNANNFSAHYYTGFNWSNGGTYWSIIARNTDELLIRQSTSSYDLTGSAVDRGNLTLSSIVGSVDDVFFNANNTKMYIVIRSAFTPNNHLRIREYSISNGFEGATSVGVSGQDNEYTEWLSESGERIVLPYCCRWSNSGNYLCVMTATDIHMFYTATPFDMLDMPKTAVSSASMTDIGWLPVMFAWWGDDTGISGIAGNGRVYSIEF